MRLTNPRGVWDLAEQVAKLLPVKSGHLCNPVAAAGKPGRYFPRDLWYKGGRDVLETHFLRNNREPEVDDPDAIRDYFQRVYRVGSLDER